MTDFKHVSTYEDDFKKGKAIAIIWSSDDVIERAAQQDVEISEDEAISILGSIERYHDATIGITWDTIDAGIDGMVNQGRDKEYIPSLEV